MAKHQQSKKPRANATADDPSKAGRRPDPRSARTRTKVLNIAERLFSRYGYDGISMREITTRANVNVGAINYYFGNKQRLFQEAYERRVGPINERRIAMLEACAQAAEEAPPNIDDVIEAFVMPLIDTVDMPQGKMVLEFINRAHNESDDVFESVIVRFNDDIWRIGGPLLERALSHLPKNVVYWRAYFMIGNLYHICRRRRWLKIRSGGASDSADLREAASHLVGYIRGGLVAPASEERMT